MNLLKCFMLVACMAYVVAVPVQQSQHLLTRGLSSQASQALIYKNVNENQNSVTRSKRWILSWLLGNGALQDHADKKREAEDKNNSKDKETPSSYNSQSVQQQQQQQQQQQHFQHKTRINHNNNNNIDEEDISNSVELHNLPGTVHVDLSSDTRVNYPEGRGRTGSLASESDAEVFDWNLLREDRDRNSGDENPHFFRSNTGSKGNSNSDVNRSSSYSSPYAQGLPIRGVVSLSRSSSQGGPKMNSFYRVPIAYEQSQEYADSRRHYRTNN